MKLKSHDGRWTVETARYTDTGWWLLVKNRNFFVGKCRTPEELAKFGVDLSEMEEVAE